MEAEVAWLMVSTLFFLGGVLSVVAGVWRGGYERSPWNPVVMAGGFLGQCVFLYLRGQEAGRCPITTPHEILVFVSWSAVLLYFVVGRAFRLSLLGMFTAPLAAVFQLVALPNLKAGPVPAEKSDFWLEMHASISLLAYGAFALAGVAGAMFLLQDALLRRGRLGGLSASLPPVTNLTHSIVRLVGVGLGLLTAGILAGLGMKQPPSSFHLTLSLMVWMIYAVLWGVRRWWGLPNGRLAWGAIGSFVLPVLTLGWMEH